MTVEKSEHLGATVAAAVSALFSFAGSHETDWILDSKVCVDRRSLNSSAQKNSIQAVGCVEV